MTSQKIKKIMAVVTIVTGVALAISVILSIWFEFQSEILWKSIGSIFILLLLFGFLHTIVQGMVEAEKSNDR